MAITVQHAASRPVTSGDGREMRHSFSFGEHYDPANVRFGLLVCHNDDLVQPGSGYADHPHTDLEIVTWVLSGALTHRSSVSGEVAVVGAGEAQALSAGSGIVHSELVDPAAGPTRFVQAWVLPDAAGGTPAYSSARVGGAVAAGELVPVASGSDPAALLRIGASATFYVANVGAGGMVTLPDAPFVHVFVASGAVGLTITDQDSSLLSEGDTARITDESARSLGALTPADVLVWTFG